jgi:hypothetical protein
MDERVDLMRPFTRAQLRDAGIDQAILRTADFKQVIRGVWVHRHGVDDDTLIRAALAIHPDTAWASHLSAAEVLRLPVPSHAFAHVSVPDKDDRRYRRRIKPHVTNRPRQLWSVRGIKVTEPAVTFVQCAGMLSLVDRVILGDSLVRRYDMSAEQLRRFCDQSTDYYAGLAREAAGYVRDGVDSPMETRLRLLIVLAGLPEPVVDYRVYDEAGRLLRRYDLCYPAIKLIIEYDGRQHAESIRQWVTDLERREELDDDDFRIIVVVAEGVFIEPGRTLHRIRRQLVLRGWGFVPPISPRWTQHFAS